VLVADPNPSQGIAIDATNLYWADTHGGVHKVSLGGGTPSMLATVGMAGFMAGYGVAVLGSTLYVTDNYQTVWSVPTAGGAPNSIATIAIMSGGVSAIAVDANNVYFSTWFGYGVGGNRVFQAPRGGGGPNVMLASAIQYPSSAVVSAQQPFNVAVQGGFVYWTSAGGADDAGSVMRVQVGGGTPQTLAMAQAYPWAIAVDATNVYWTNLGTSAHGFADGAVMRVPLAGGSSPTPLASGLGEPSAIAVDATDVYFGEGATILRVPITGGSGPTVVASEPGPAIVSMAVDATSIYWSDTAIVKVAK
jgi:hypothetical protein